jgi:hypothetical protein
MTTSNAPAPHSATISAVITRADGTVEHVGVIAAGYDNPLKQWWWDHVGRRLSERRIHQINQRASKER